MEKRLTTIFALALAGCMTGFGQETLPPLGDGKAPESFEELWAGFDPRAEPLEVEILKEWFTYKPEDWARRTHKLYDAQWQAPTDAMLAFEIRSEMPNKLVVGIDAYAAEVPLPGNSGWHPVTLTPADFLDASGEPLQAWADIKELRLGSRESLRSKSRSKEQRRSVGAGWMGPKPEFRNLRWIPES